MKGHRGGNQCSAGRRRQKTILTCGSAQPVSLVHQQAGISPQQCLACLPRQIGESSVIQPVKLLITPTKRCGLVEDAHGLVQRSRIAGSQAGDLPDPNRIPKRGLNRSQALAPFGLRPAKIPPRLRQKLSGLSLG